MSDLVRIARVPADPGLQIINLCLGRQAFWSRSDLHLLYREVVIDGTYRPHLPLRPDALIVDAGANIGMATLWFARHEPSSRIIAIEPSPEAAAAAERTIEANGLPNVDLHRAALTSDGRPVRLTRSTDRPASPVATVLQTDEAGDDAIDVASVRLSDLLTDEPTIDLLKLDVEGSEHEIVADLRSSGVLDRVSQAIVEVTTGRRNHSIGPTITALEASGMVVHVDAQRRVGRNRQDVLLICFRPRA